jgi:putative ABC transport system ATP-binding protein
MMSIELSGVGKVFHTNSIPRTALADIDLRIESGEFACLAGPSGSGKTTLLNLIGALDTPTSGALLVDGCELTGLSRTEAARFRRERIGFVFQSFNLVPVLSAYENVEYTLLLRGMKERERRRRVEEVLDSVGLAEHMHKRPAELSGGQQQRVAVARAIVGEPAIVLADEPTGSLDSATGAGLLELLEAINRERGATFLFSSHDENIIGRARRVIMLKDGGILRDDIRSAGSMIR